MECACRVIIDELDDPAHPIKPTQPDASIGLLVGTANRLLKLSDIRHRKFADLVKHHNNITDALRELRNEAGTVSHGKDGFIARLSAHHRRAAVLSADAIVTYLHEAYLEANFNLSLTREPCERFDTFNDLIDNAVSLEAETDEAGDLNVTIRLPGDDLLTITATPSRFLYQMDRAAYIEALNAARSVVSLEPALSPAEGEPA